jgi:hypothetical protein
MKSVFYVFNGRKFQKRIPENTSWTPPGGSQVFASFEEWSDYQAPVKSLENFIEQCYLIPGFATEVAVQPGWLVVQQRLEKGDYANALAVFGAMGVPQAIIDAMLPLAQANELPQPVIDALSS